MNVPWPLELTSTSFYKDLKNPKSPHFTSEGCSTLMFGAYREEKQLISAEIFTGSPTVQELRYWVDVTLRKLQSKSCFHRRGELQKDHRPVRRFLYSSSPKGGWYDKLTSSILCEPLNNIDIYCILKGSYNTFTHHRFSWPFSWLLFIYFAAMPLNLCL